MHGSKQTRDIFVTFLQSKHFQKPIAILGLHKKPGLRLLVSQIHFFAIQGFSQQIARGRLHFGTPITNLGFSKTICNPGIAQTRTNLCTPHSNFNFSQFQDFHNRMQMADWSLLRQSKIQGFTRQHGKWWIATWNINPTTTRIPRPPQAPLNQSR